MSGMYPVLVRVRGIQRDETGRENTIESVSAGRHSVKNAKHYVLYDDLLLNEKQKTPTVLKFHDGELVLLRRGGMDQELRFRKGMQTQSKYRTPYGTLDMAVRTTRLDICCGLLEGRIDAEYDIAVNGQYQSTNRLHIEVTHIADQKEKTIRQD